MHNININIDNPTDIYNKYNNNYLNDDLDNYLLTNTKYIKRKEKITLNIKGNINKEDQIKIKKTINKHYMNKYNSLKIIDKYDDIYRFILLIIGISFIIISEKLISFISELFLIAGWVVIWEMIYDILFNQLKRNKDKNHYQKLASAKIKYQDEEDNQ